MPRRPRPHTDPVSLFAFQDVMTCLTGVLILIALVLALNGLNDEMQAEAGSAAPAAAEAALAEAREQAAQMTQEVEALRRELAARQAGSQVTVAEIAVLEARISAAMAEADRLRERIRNMAEEAVRLAAARDAARAELAALDARRAQAEQAARRERVRFRPGIEGDRTPFFIEVSAAGVRIGELDDQRAPVLTTLLHPAATDAQVARAVAERPPADHYAVFVVHADGIARFEALRDTMFRRGYETGWQLWGAEAGPFLEAPP